MEALCLTLIPRIQNRLLPYVLMNNIFTASHFSGEGGTYFTYHMRRLVDIRRREDRVKDRKSLRRRKKQNDERQIALDFIS